MSTDLIPSTVVSRIGKKARIEAITTFDVMPKPNQTTNSGTSATFGMTWVAITNGLSMRSRRGILPSRKPRPTPKMLAKTKPRKVSHAVTPVWNQTLLLPRNPNHATTTSEGGGSTSLLTLNNWT